MKKYWPVFVIILSMMMCDLINNNEDYKEYGPWKILSGDSAKFKSVYIPEDSSMSYTLDIFFTQNGCAKEAYESNDFDASLLLLESHGIELKEVQLYEPIKVWTDLKFDYYLRYSDRVRMSPKTYHRISGINLSIISHIVNEHLPKQPKSE